MVACQHRFTETIKYLVGYKCASILEVDTNTGRSALDSLLTILEPSAAVQLFTSLPAMESDECMIRWVDDHPHNQAGSDTTSTSMQNAMAVSIQFPLNDGEFLIRGSDERSVALFWSKKVGGKHDLYNKTLYDITNNFIPCLRRPIFPLFSPTRIVLSKENDTNNSNPTHEQEEAKDGDSDNTSLTRKSIQARLCALDLHMTWINATADARYPVKSYTLPFESMSNTEFLRAFVMITDRTGSVELFENENIKVAVLSAWEGSGRIYHIQYCILYILFLGLLSYSNDVYDTENNGVMGSILALVAIFTTYELTQCYRQGLTSYLSDAQNVFELAGYILTIIGIGIRIYNMSETSVSREILAIASILVWVNSLNLLRPFRLTGSLIRMVFAVVSAMTPFFIILALVLYGFSQAFYLLTYGSTDDVDFSTAALSYLSSFRYLMNGSQYYANAGVNSDLLIFITVLFVTFTNIILLNLLIAFLTSIYSDIQAHAEAEMFKERCKVSYTATVV